MICPHCKKPIDIGDKDVGTRLYHPDPCGRWMLIGRMPTGEKYAVEIEPPVTWPKDRRER